MIHYMQMDDANECDPVWLTRLSLGALFIAIALFFASGVSPRFLRGTDLAILAEYVIGLLGRFTLYTRILFPMGVWLITTRPPRIASVNAIDPIAVALRILSI